MKYQKYKIVILTLCLVFSVSLGSTNTKNDPAITAKKTNDQPLSTKIEVIHEESGKTADKNTGKTIYIDFKYPQIDGLPDKTTSQIINAKIKTAVVTQIKKLRSEYKEINGTSTVVTYTQEILSIKMNILCDLLPYHMAHPVNSLVTLNYDLKNKKELKLNDLFVGPQNKYLPAIAKIAEEDIVNQFKKEGILSEKQNNPNEQIELDWVKKGIDPKPNNYKNFLITKDGIIFIFDYYQLGPRNVGEPQITIPFAKLDSFINKAGVLISLLPPSPPKKPELNTKNIIFNPEIIHEENSNGKVYIDFKYPAMTGLSDTTTQEAINEQIKAKILDWVNNYKKDNQVVTNEFSTTITNNLLSLKFTIDIDKATWPPLNNPVYKILTLNYDLSNKKEIHLEDLFKPSSNYLQVLSDAAFADLKEQLKNNSDFMNVSEEKIKEITAPKPENYQNFLFNNKGLTFIFDNDKMTLHKANHPKVLILYGKIENLLDPAGPLASVADS